MSTRYLLPCRCGKKIPVETSQAGQVLRCECGQDVEVPTLLKLRSLEAVEEKEAFRPVAKASWGVSQGITIVSAVVMLLAVAGLVFFYMVRPMPPQAVFTEQMVEQDIQGLTLAQADNIWMGLRNGLGVPQPIGPAYRAALKTYTIPKYATVDEAYREAKKQYRIRMGVTLVILTLATSAMIFGLVMTRARKLSVLGAELVDSSA